MSPPLAVMFIELLIHSVVLLSINIKEILCIRSLSTYRLELIRCLWITFQANEVNNGRM